MRSLDLETHTGPELIVCPTCGRTEIDIIKLARQVERALRHQTKSCRVAVMGCVVNGPGEAEDADVAICAGKEKAYLYVRGRKVGVLAESEIVPRLLTAISEL